MNEKDTLPMTLCRGKCIVMIRGIFMRLKNKCLLTFMMFGLILSSLTLSVHATSVNPDRDKLHNPVHNCSVHDAYHYSNWSTVKFGSYPQSIVTDKALQAAIDAQLIANGSYVGKAKYVVGDCVVNGVKYRKVRIGDIGPNATENFEDLFMTDEENKHLTYGYFRFEPIRWRVLSVDKANNKMLLISDQAIDAYGGMSLWKDSQTREFLNCYREVESPNATTSFYRFKETAFNAEESKAILKTSGITGTNPDKHYQTAERNAPVDDYIFLLSWEQIYNSAYGFCPKKEQSDSRVIWGTPYAVAGGCEAYISSGVIKKSDCTWWLCTDNGSLAPSQYSVTDKGALNVEGTWETHGVVPAMWISMDSLRYSYAGETAGGDHDYIFQGKKFISGKLRFCITDVKKREVSYYGTAVKGLTTVKIPNTVKDNGYTYKVTKIPYNVHKDDKKLKSLTIGNYVKEIDTKAFYNCKNLTSVKFGKNVQRISMGAFQNCKKLKSVNLGNRVEYINSQAFKNCKSIKSVTIGKSLKSVGFEAFANCGKLKKVTIKSKKLSQLEEKSFAKMAKKSTITLPKKYKKAEYKWMRQNCCTKSRTKIKYK